MREKPTIENLVLDRYQFFVFVLKFLLTELVYICNLEIEVGEKMSSNITDDSKKTCKPPKKSKLARVQLACL